MTGVPTVTHSSRLFEGRYIDEGYEFVGAGEAKGWRAVSSWGRDGWDLGDWPYVVYLFREREGAYERACYSEGTITIETYATAEERERATDETAAFYWRRSDIAELRKILDPIPEGDELPERVRGPFSWKRLDDAAEDSDIANQPKGTS